MPRLKTFQAHLGFFDTVVAAPSQKAALEAWGSRQNLFRDGTAKQASDPDAIAAATAHPGVVLKRLAGSKDPFVTQPPLPKSTRPKALSGKAVMLHAAKNRHGQERQLQKPRPVTTPPKRPPDRSKLDAAERALAQLHAMRKTMRAEFERRENSLRAEQHKHEQEVQARQQELERELASERKRFLNAVKTRS